MPNAVTIAGGAQRLLDESEGRRVVSGTLYDERRSLVGGDAYRGKRAVTSDEHLRGTRREGQECSWYMLRVSLDAAAALPAVSRRVPIRTIRRAGQSRSRRDGLLPHDGTRVSTNVLNILNIVANSPSEKMLLA